LCITLSIQSLIIISGTLNLIPLTGVTLPFVSYGGSSLLTNFIIVGMLLALSREAAADNVIRETLG
jgi:cell division protein FtsW